MCQVLTRLKGLASWKTNSGVSLQSFGILEGILSWIESKSSVSAIFNKNILKYIQKELNTRVTLKKYITNIQFEKISFFTGVKKTLVEKLCDSLFRYGQSKFPLKI